VTPPAPSVRGLHRQSTGALTSRAAFPSPRPLSQCLPRAVARRCGTIALRERRQSPRPETLLSHPWGSSTLGGGIRNAASVATTRKQHSGPETRSRSRLVRSGRLVTVTETLAGEPKHNCDRGTGRGRSVAWHREHAVNREDATAHLARNARPAVHMAPKSTASRTAASQSGQGEQQVRSPTLAVSFR
jgi:hypothetical protein